MPKQIKLALTVFFTLFLLLGLVNNVWATTCEEAKGTCRGINLESGNTCQTEEKEAKENTCPNPTYEVCCVASAAPPSTKPTGALTKEFKTEAVGVPDLNKLGGQGEIPARIGGVVKALLGITGAIALLMVVYGAITLLMSRGGEGVKKGKDILIWAAIGSIVVLGSYVLVDYAIKGLKGEGSSGGGAGSGGSGNGDANKECIAFWKDDTAKCTTITCSKGKITEENQSACINEYIAEQEKNNIYYECSPGLCNEKGQGYDTVCCLNITQAAGEKLNEDKCADQAITPAIARCLDSKNGDCTWQGGIVRINLGPDHPFTDCPEPNICCIFEDANAPVLTHKCPSDHICYDDYCKSKGLAEPTDVFECIDIIFSDENIDGQNHSFYDLFQNTHRPLIDLTGPKCNILCVLPK